MPVDSVAVEKVETAPGVQDSGARNVLLAFEGGTGDKGIEGQPASQSLMALYLFVTILVQTILTFILPFGAVEVGRALGQRCKR